jgi:hypothetical protein
VLLVVACGDDGGAADGGVDTGASGDGGEADGAIDGSVDAADTGALPDAADSAPPDAAMADCDFREVDGVVVIEAESLPLTESWETRTAETGFTGSGYIQWTGSSFNNDPTHGVMEVTLCLEGASRYRLQWHTRIGIGNDTTEHNDSWVQFGDVDDYFGARGPSDGETRRYPHPQCDDGPFMTMIRGLATVTEATCAAGSSRDGWMKVYCSGASDWRWSTSTSDSDAHQVVFETDGAGVVRLMLAARAEGHLIDRIVIHDASLPDATVQDLTLAETSAE